jgi:hypothetical protein
MVTTAKTLAAYRLHGAQWASLVVILAGNDDGHGDLR